MDATPQGVKGFEDGDDDDDDFIVRVFLFSPSE